MNEITSYQKCNCGAVTLHFSDGQANSAKQRNLSSLGIRLKGVRRERVTTFCCDHCVNHYGLDLCACGSGKTPKSCKEGLKECGLPRQYFGTSVKYTSWS